MIHARGIRFYNGGYLYGDTIDGKPTIVIQCERILLIGDKVEIAPDAAVTLVADRVDVIGKDTADIRGNTVILHGDDVLKVDCAGVGERLNASEYPGVIVRRNWDHDSWGAGYERHAPEIPLEGPPLEIEPDGGGTDGGPPWDRFGDE